MQHFARSQVEQIDPDILQKFVKELTIQGYLQCLATVALIYDALITMDREIRYFWKVPRRPVDFIYFANRYIGIFGAVAAIFVYTFPSYLEECNFALWTSNLCNWLSVILTDYILTIRVLALYSRGRKLATCLYLFLALEAVMKLAIVSYGTVYEHRARDFTLCAADKYVPWWLGVIDWSVQLVFGVTLMVLALYKAAEYWRLSAGFKGFPLVKVLIEDQIIYFMSVILVVIFAILELRIQTTNAIASNVLDVLGNQSFLCILGSRMLLNLKEAGERGQNEGTSFKAPSRTVSDIEFGEAPANVEANQTNEAAECSQDEGMSFYASSGIVDDIEFGVRAVIVEAGQTGEAAERSQNEGTSFVASSGVASDIKFGKPATNIEASVTEAANGE